MVSLLERCLFSFKFSFILNTLRGNEILYKVSSNVNVLYSFSIRGPVPLHLSGIIAFHIFWPHLKRGGGGGVGGVSSGFAKLAWYNFLNFRNIM